jgi:hypothetical protein
LKNNGKGENKLPEAYMFDTGAKNGKLMMLGLRKNTENKILSARK